MTEPPSWLPRPAGFTCPSAAAHFQAKFKLAICIYRHWQKVLDKPEEILHHVFAHDRGEGLRYVEYRAMASSFSLGTDLWANSVFPKITLDNAPGSHRWRRAAPAQSQVLRARPQYFQRFRGTS